MCNFFFWKNFERFSIIFTYSSYSLIRYLQKEKVICIFLVNSPWNSKSPRKIGAAADKKYKQTL